MHCRDHMERFATSPAQHQSVIEHFHAETDKNSSGDEIANVNFYAVRPGSYWNSLK